MMLTRASSKGAVLLAAAAILLPLLSGCVGTSTGFVTLQIRATAGSRPLDITVRDGNNKVIDHEKLASGTSTKLGGVPYGRITVSAAGLCTLQTSIGENHRTMDTIFDDKHCTVG